MKVGRFATHLGYSLLGVLVVMSSAWASGALAHDDAGAFVKVVRESNRRFQDVSVALADGQNQ